MPKEDKSSSTKEYSSVLITPSEAIQTLGPHTTALSGLKSIGPDLLVPLQIDLQIGLLAETVSMISRGCSELKSPLDSFRLCKDYYVIVVQASPDHRNSGSCEDVARF